MKDTHDTLPDNELTRRLHELGWNQNRLVKEFCKLRAENGVVPPIRKYQSTVRKTLINPERAWYRNYRDVVIALYGSCSPVWVDNALLQSDKRYHA
jgi:hypothetical protein